MMTVVVFVAHSASAQKGKSSQARPQRSSLSSEDATPALVQTVSKLDIGTIPFSFFGSVRYMCSRGKNQNHLYQDNALFIFWLFALGFENRNSMFLVIFF